MQAQKTDTNAQNAEITVPTHMDRPILARPILNEALQPAMSNVAFKKMRMRLVWGCCDVMTLTTQTILEAKPNKKKTSKIIIPKK